MKKIRFILLAVSIISLCAISGPAMAQVKSKVEKEEELKMQEEIDAQKKVISEQKKHSMRYNRHCRKAKRRSTKQ
jgi:hypothetical protein